MADGENGVFRQKAIDRMSSPDELVDYLKVTNASVWVVLAAIAVLLVGILAWACVGTLETKAQAKVLVKDEAATVLLMDSQPMRQGMTLTVSDREYPITSTTIDASGDVVGHTTVELPDGTYNGTVVVGEMRAIDFLIEST